MDRRWAQPLLRREQQVLFAQTLDEAVPSEHPIRMLDAVLQQLDWDAWEAQYARRLGQPPIHPRYLAGAILYGLMRGVRSSRELEDATRERIDFRWYLEGQTVDHSTFADFRVKFSQPLKSLSRQITRLICTQFEQSLLTLVLDGTRIRANSDRHGTRTAEGLERLIAACVRELEAKLDGLGQADAQAEENAHHVEQLHTQIAELNAQVAHYRKALEVAQHRDKKKRKKKGNKASHVSVPVTDPDAILAPNKEGGFAPNYTPTVAVDAASLAIISAEVQHESNEDEAVLPAVAYALTLGGNVPSSVLADTSFGSTKNLRELEDQHIDAYMPTGTDFSADNPANRADPTQPIAPEQWKKLPLRDKRLAHSAFLYDAEQDQYRCPMGVALTFQKTCKDTHNGDLNRHYTCPGKDGCPLAAQCVKADETARSLIRHPSQDLRDRVGRRMATDEGVALYRKRAPVVEGVFAYLKHIMGIRRFLLRGLDKVRTEWTWICTAYNLKRLLAPLYALAKREKALRQALCTRISAVLPGIDAPEYPQTRFRRKNTSASIAYLIPVW